MVFSKRNFFRAAPQLTECLEEVIAANVIATLYKNTINNGIHCTMNQPKNSCSFLIYLCGGDYLLTPANTEQLFGQKSSLCPAVFKITESSNCY